MEQALLVSNAVLWVVVLVLCAVVVALVRQIGVLYERVAPAGALLTGGGPAVGDPSPRFELEDLSGRPVRIGGESAEGRSTLVFFLSPRCSVCSALLPALKSVQRSERHWLDLVLASDGEPAEQRAFAAEKGLTRLPYVLSSELGMRFQIGRLPYAVLIDERGFVAARGLVNTREHLESLFEAKRRGVASIQEYAARQAPGAARRGGAPQGQ
jgi:methylamine dehydrogenase accessory protein MauD